MSVRSNALLSFPLACAALLLVACDGAGPRDQVVAVRLLEHFGPEYEATIGDTCFIGGELRPALGCTGWAPLRTVVVPDRPERYRVAVPVPRLRKDRPFLLGGWVIHANGSLGRLPPVTHPASDLARVDFAALGDAAPPPGARVALRIRSAPRPRAVTRPVDVPAGATLLVSVGLDPALEARGVERVEFRLTALGSEEAHTVLATSLRPGADEAVWHEHRVDLAPVAGREVRFRFETLVTPQPGITPARAAVMPLWGAPEILAPAPSEGSAAPNVVLVSFDTLRADGVGAYGSDRPTTPNLDRLAEAGTIFERTYTTYPTTTAAHTSMLTGLYPRRHGVRSPTDVPRAEVTPLARILGRAGWRTGAVTENGMLTTRAGVARGFSSYRENKEPEKTGNVSRTVEETFAAAADWIRGAAGHRFFLFVHTYVAHWPYKPAPEFDSFRTWMDGEIERPRKEAPYFLRLRLLYSSETRFGDAQIPVLMKTLHDLGIDDRTLVVVTSDHGQEFGEHGHWGHGKTVYDEVLHVPLVLWGPGVPTGLRVGSPVSLVDVAPTILELANVPAPADLDGVSLVPALAGSTAPPRTVFAERGTPNHPEGHRIAARTATAKWIGNPGALDEMEAYDLTADPAETTPITDPARLARGRALLERYLRRAAPTDAPTADEAEPLDESTQEKLRALGYLE